MTFGLFIGGALCCALSEIQKLESPWPFVVASVPGAMMAVFLSMIIADTVVSLHVEAFSSELTGMALGVQKLFHFGCIAIAPITSVGLYLASPELGFLVPGAFAILCATIVLLLSISKRPALEEAKVVLTPPGAEVAPGAGAA